MSLLARIVFLSFIFLGFTGALAQAQELPANPIVANVPEYSGVQGSLTDYLCTPSDPPDGQDVERCINKAYRFGVSFGAIALVFFVVLAGYLYITGGETGKTKAKGMLRNALTGMVILLSSYALLSFINPNLTAFKSIQPPIFDAADLPKCEDVGFGENCVLPGGTVGKGEVGGWGERIACPGGKIVSAKELGLPTKQNDEQICEEFGVKLSSLTSLLKGINWRITDTIGPGHDSPCHKPNNSLSGTCADIGITDKSTENWNKICKALLLIGDLQPVNETEDSAVTQCGKLVDYRPNEPNPHLHVNWRKGNGSKESPTSSGKGDCITHLEIFCAHPPEALNLTSYPSEKWADWPYVRTDEMRKNLKDLRTAYDKLVSNRKGNIPPLHHVYRPHEYASHMRSVYEAYVLAPKDSGGLNWSDEQLLEINRRYPHTNYRCKGVQFVKKSSVMNMTKEQRNYMEKHKVHFAGYTINLTQNNEQYRYDSTCLSDHGFGTALDLDAKGKSPSYMTQLKKDALAVGLCHNLPFDTNHFTLKLAAEVINPEVDCLK